MAQRIEFKLNKDDYIELGRRAFEKNDVEEAIGFFKTACRLSGESSAYVELGRAYSKMHALEVSNAILYKAMSLAKNEEEENAVLWQLCSNEMELGDAELASYYLRYLGEEDGAVIETAPAGKSEPRFYVAAKTPDEYYRNSLKRINAAMADNDIDGAMKMLRELEDAPAPYINTVRKMKTLCLFARGDFDRVTVLAEEIAAADPTPDNRATLATAYGIQDRKEEANALLDGLMAEKELPPEVAMKALPLLINYNRDEDILRLTLDISARSGDIWQFSEMYRAEALYNLGRKKEALRVMTRMDNIYGDFSAAAFYVRLFGENPERVPYGHDVPHQMRLDMVNLVKTVLERPPEERHTALIYDKQFNIAFNWLLYYGPDVLLCPALLYLTELRSRRLEDILRERLIGQDLTFDCMMIILDYLMHGHRRMEVDLVTQGRYKQIDFILPEAYYKLPKRIQRTVYRAACDIVFTDEDPTTYLERLSDVVADIAVLGDDGSLMWKVKDGRRLTMLRSDAAIVGVLLAEVYYDDPDPEEDAMSRYNIPRRTFYKYKNLFFGGDDEDKE